jgi:hypothetical protein
VEPKLSLVGKTVSNAYQLVTVAVERAGADRVKVR